MVIRVYRYAKQHVDRADVLLKELIVLRKKFGEWASRTNSIYTDALANSYSYVPINFMRGNNETNRYKMKMEEMQSQVVLNLSLSLSFCAELVYLMVHESSEEALGYKIRVRRIIDQIIEIATNEAMDNASLASLAPSIAKIESVITLYDFDRLRLMKNRLMNFRNRIS